MKNDVLKDKAHNFLAFDIGATSGRSILGTVVGGELKMKELTRFPNKIINVQGKLYWNIYSLFESLKEALKLIAKEEVVIDSIGIDTWGVDFVYLSENGSIIELPRSYRDPYTTGIPEEVFKSIPKKELYALTGIQIMNFNSLFQLYAARKENSFALKNAKTMLFMPDALAYMLTGEKVCEYTILSTSQLLNPKTKKVEKQLLDRLELPFLLEKIVMPADKIGVLHPNVAKECGVGQIPVVAVAGHDTASAVASIPAESKNIAYISSGTWSLMGIEVDEPIITEESSQHNLTNEGGVDGTTRFLKNIAGMWLLEECRRKWGQDGKNYTYGEIVKMAQSAEGFKFLVEPDDSSFASPQNMIDSIVEYCEKTGQGKPQTDAEIIRCIFDSLAFKYKYTLNSLQRMAPFNIETLHVIGGGSQNALLNQMTANALNIPVVAGPSEATAIGNIMLQAKGVGLVDSLDDMRKIIRNSVKPELFLPQNQDVWEKEYEKYLSVVEPID